MGGFRRSRRCLSGRRAVGVAARSHQNLDSRQGETSCWFIRGWVGGQALRDTARAMSQENVEIVRSIYDCWANGDFSASEWADDAIEFEYGAGSGGRGTDVMASVWLDLLKTMDDFAVVPERFLDVGDDRVLVLARFSGRGKGSGAPVGEFLGGSLFTLSQDKVVRLALFTDRKQALEAAGLSE